MLIAALARIILLIAALFSLTSVLESTSFMVLIVNNTENLTIPVNRKSTTAHRTPGSVNSLLKMSILSNAISTSFSLLLLPIDYGQS